MQLHQGPPAETGLAAWCGEDVRRLPHTAFSIAYSLSGVYALLHRLMQLNLVQRPQPPQVDLAAQARFKNSANPPLGRHAGRASRSASALWFQDEVRFGQQGSNRLVETIPTVGRRRHGKPSTTLFILVCAVCPQTGDSNAWQMPSANTETMNIQLRTLTAQMAHGVHVLLVLGRSIEHAGRNQATSEQSTDQGRRFPVAVKRLTATASAFQ